MNEMEQSILLQQEMPGLRGFSKGNIKKMCRFYEEWMPIFGSLPTNQIQSPKEYGNALGKLEQLKELI